MASKSKRKRSPSSKQLQTKRKRTLIDPTVFCDAWEAAETVDTVAEKFGLSVEECKAKARLFRRPPRNIPLKQFPVYYRKHDWSALAERVKSGVRPVHAAKRQRSKKAKAE